jgi:endonuclease III
MNGASRGSRVKMPARRRPARRPKRLDAAAVRALYGRLRAGMPAPRTELVYRTPYQLLVAVILSAQATDRSVNLATRRLFAVAGTPEAMVALGARGLARHIRTIGLWRMKAKNVVAASRMILERHGGEVPRERAALEALPGVGRKTANVILNTAFGEPTIAVDTHIFRVANRTGLAPGKNVRQVEDGLVAATPPEFAQDAHHWLILHGRYTCTARGPKCPQCPVRDLCLWPEKTPPAAGVTSSSG